MFSIDVCISMCLCEYLWLWGIWGNVGFLVGFDWVDIQELISDFRFSNGVTAPSDS